MTNLAINCRISTAIDRAIRGGFTIVEMVATASILMIVLASLVPMLAGFHEARRDLESVTLAINEVQNVLERVHAEHRAGRFDVDSLSAVEIDEDLKPFLGDTSWSTAVDQIESPPGQRLTLTLTYGKRHQRAATLSTWLWEGDQ